MESGPFTFSSGSGDRQTFSSSPPVTFTSGRVESATSTDAGGAGAASFPTATSDAAPTSGPDDIDPAGDLLPRGFGQDGQTLTAERQDPADARSDTDPVFDTWRELSVDFVLESEDIVRIARYGSEIWFEYWRYESGEEGSGENCYQEKYGTVPMERRDGTLVIEGLAGGRDTDELVPYVSEYSYDQEADQLVTKGFVDGELDVEYRRERALEGTDFVDLPICR